MKFIKKGILNTMKKYISFALIIVLFIIFGIRLSIILSNNSFYEKKLIEKTNIYVNGISAPRGRILDTNGNNIWIIDFLQQEAGGVCINGFVHHMQISRQLFVASCIPPQNCSDQGWVEHILTKETHIGRSDIHGLHPFD